MSTGAVDHNNLRHHWAESGFGKEASKRATETAIVDLLLALRWWCYANVFDPGAAYVKDLKAARNAKKATRKRA